MAASLETLPWQQHKSQVATIYYMLPYKRLAEHLGRRADQFNNRIQPMISDLKIRQVDVFITENLEQMRRLAGVNVNEWTAALAILERNLILVRLDSHSISAGTLDQLFDHELAHLALAQTVAPGHIPTWFHEGLAIFLSGQWSYERAATLGQAVFSDRLFSLQALQRSFPDAPDEVAIAYAQSIDFVAFLHKRYGPKKLQRLIHLCQKGWPFLIALEEAFDEGLHAIENAWRLSLQRRFTWLFMAFGSTTIWFLVALILVAAFLRKRHTKAIGMQMLAATEEEEENDDPPPLSPSSP
jgi:hypothetical protein